MTDAPLEDAPRGPRLDPAAMLRGLLRSDLALAVGILAILVMLILPMPRWMLDMALAVSISFSVLVLMTALFIKTPLEFTSFPTVLLIATMLRLGLNIASTRLILSEGHSGPDAAGAVIEAFGSFVMQGNFVIGAIVFIILVIVNFVVITKGSGRIAEVAARFTLDAMPGKQMAIDADLSAGLITEAEARKRRQELEAESNFFGSMDGASKFVRGDAVAGLMITAVNIIAGMIIGMAQHGMPAGAAASAYTTLTIGDGLVSQIPALIVSVAAGLLVSKAGVRDAADKALGSQLTGYPQALSMVAAICGIAGLLPGMPPVPFFTLAALAGWGAWFLSRRRADRAAETEAVEAAEAAEAPAEEPISDALAMDAVRLELGYALLPLINEMEGRRLTDQIKALRRALATEMGFVMPQVRILDNLQLGENTYVLRIKEIDAGEGELRLRCLLAMDPSGRQVELPGEHVKEPAFGLPATWVDENLREEATFRGYTVVDPATVLTTHLTEALKEQMPELFTFAAMEKLLADLPPEQAKLLDDVIQGPVTRASVHRVLQNLLRERVSIRDLPTILEGLADAGGARGDLVAMTEIVRARLARQLCWAHRGPEGDLALVTLSPQWEQTLNEALIGEGEQRQLALAPTQLQQFVQGVRDAFAAAGQTGEAPVLLTGAAVRPYVRSLVERFRPETVVLSQNEIFPRARIRTVGQV